MKKTTKGTGAVKVVGTVKGMRIESQFRRGGIMYAIVHRATRNSISRHDLIQAVAKATGASVRTIQSEISYLLNPKDHRNGNRVKGDARMSYGRIRLVAA